MAELEQILHLMKENNVPFPIRLGIMSKSNRELAEIDANPTDYIIAKTDRMYNAEELERWLIDNKELRNILLVPALGEETTFAKYEDLRKKQQKAAKKTNEILKKKNPNHYREAAKKRWENNKNST